jgi:hypothetical protein
VRRLLLCLLPALLLAPLSAAGGEILDASVEVSDRQYRVAVKVRIEAPPRLVYATITDYAALPKLTPSIRSARVLQVTGPGRHRIETVTRACILIFCKDVRQVQDVAQLDAFNLEAVTLPGGSDLKSGLAHWRLEPAGEATLMHFSQRFEPDFWVPAVIGPWMIRRLLLGEVRATTAHIEREHAGGATDGG